MTWNVAFDKMLEIKRTYEKRFGKEDEYAGDNWLMTWADKTGVEEYKAILSELIIQQHRDLVLLHYRIPHEIDGSDYFDAYGGVLAECRSLVIDLRKERMVLTPFRKFRNMGECEETSEDNVARRIRDAKVIEFSEKLDGSMQSARMVDGVLVMSGSRSLDRRESYRLDGGYRYVLSHENYFRMLSDNPRLTFIFESIFDNDPHVVSYDTEGLYLVGIRDSDDGREYDYRDVIDMADRYSVPTTSLYTFSFDDALEYISSASGREHEGFVLNIDGFRVKMKSDDYVRINNWVFGLKDDNILLRAVLAEEIDDIIPKLPQGIREDVIRRTRMITDTIEHRKRTVEHHICLLNGQNLTEKKDAMIWIEKNVPLAFRSMVRCRYLGQNVDYAKGITMKEVMRYKSSNQSN